MIFYLTVNDSPSGIYSSQVIDVVNFIHKELKTEIKLVSFISLRGFRANKQKIRNSMPDAIVVPMFPGVKRWKRNIFTLNLICKRYEPDAIIGRSVMATFLALKLKEKNKIKKVIYDGRGAISAEWKEYGVITDQQMLAEISSIEKQVINFSDKRIAVSNELVNYWKKEYDYKNANHVVIPCTINKAFENLSISEEKISMARKNLKLNSNDIVFAYSGSVSGWQSFGLMLEFMQPILKSEEKAKLLFLSPAHEYISRLEKEFPGKIIRRNVSPEEVPQLLVAADYGLLIREQSVTNKVASPVKFAEYLACGLKVLISENLGDYSSFVYAHNCGCIYSEFNESMPVGNDEKKKLNQIATAFFSKQNYKNQYRQIVETQS